MNDTPESISLANAKRVHASALHVANDTRTRHSRQLMPINEADTVPKQPLSGRYTRNHVHIMLFDADEYVRRRRHEPRNAVDGGGRCVDDCRVGGQRAASSSPNRVCVIDDDDDDVTPPQTLSC